MRKEFYPEIEPNRHGFLKPDGIHQVYWEECGNPEGTPVIFVHGGPGVGSTAYDRRFFNPELYRIILFDQRGSGRSLPLGEIRNNHQDFLVSDMEAIRSELDINKWHVFGGSWGSTLGLYYAIKHPQRCISLTLRGIYLHRKEEIDYFINGMGLLFPEVQNDFESILSESEKEDILESYYHRLNSEDQHICMEAAKAWSIHEAACCTLLPNEDFLSSLTQDKVALSVSRLENLYMRDNRFEPDNFLIENIDKVRDIPARIIQGRYDVVAPLKTAYDLSQAWPEAEFIIVPDAGHSSHEPGIRHELISATDHFAKFSS
jgi:proline iminopeptidase